MASKYSRIERLGILSITFLFALILLMDFHFTGDVPVLPIGVYVAILGLYILFKSPVLFLDLYFAGLVLIRAFPRITFGPLYTTEVVLFALLGRMILTRKAQRFLSIYNKRNPIAFPLAAFLCLGIISLVRGFPNGMTAARDSVTVLYGVTILLVTAILVSREDLRRFLRLIPIIALALNVMLLVRMFTVGFARTEMATPRLFGARTSAFLFFAGALSVSGLFGKQLSTRKFLRGFGIAQFCIIILLSGTRNVWIATAASFFFWQLFVKKVRISAKLLLSYTLLAVVFGLLIVGLSNTDYTGESVSVNYRLAATSIVQPEKSANAMSRLSWWRDAVEITINENPLLGRPFGSVTLFTKYDLKYGRHIRMAFHNSYITVLYYTGFLGLSLLLLIAYRILRLGLRQIHSARAPETERLSAALTTSFFFYCVVAFFNVILEGPQSAMFFWLIAGLLIVLRRVSLRENIIEEHSSSRDMRIDHQT
jgi:O-antigen ligase